MSAEREVSYEAAMIDGGPHGAGDPTVLAILGPNVVTPDASTPRAGGSPTFVRRPR
jgi:hypothetical protein